MSQSTHAVSDEIQQLKQTYPKYNGQLKHAVSIPAESANTIDATKILRERISSRLPHDGLFTHQADALNILKRGKNACITTSTSSGKTLIYALQIARNYIDDSTTTALLIFPTKALSRNQEHALNELYTELGLDITVSVYDGDTPGRRRKQIRSNSDVIITNYSGANTYLNQHELWDSFYSNLDLIAIDESHSYTGIHGMHVAWVNRRLRRVADHYGADPQFVLTSATIGNPADHSKNLTGVDVEVVSDDGSPQGEQNIAFWRPPIQEQNDGSETQRPAGPEASEVLAHITNRGMQSLMFTRSRKQTELSAQRARQEATENTVGSTPDIESYNAGHGKETRRSVEGRLKSGNIDGVVTTNALELGIDIGSVDATVLSGYPGTRQSFWQQLGRAGRGTNSALGIFVTRHDSIDQYILDNPEYLLDDTNIEDAVVDLENNYVFAKHILCAAQEIPLTKADSEWFNAYRMESAVKMWRDAGKLVGTLENGVQYDSTRRPQSDISMYASSDDQFEIRCDEEDVDIDSIGRERAFRDYHEGAINLHKGQQYEVVELNQDNPNPYVKIQPVNVDYYTQAMSEKTITDVRSEKSRELTEDMTLHWGRGRVDVEYDAYQKVDLGSNNPKPQKFPIDLPAIEMETQMMWVEVDTDRIDEVVEDITPGDDMSNKEAALGALHAIEHGIISLSPLELRMDKQDLGGLSQMKHGELDWNGAFFVYDGVNGGVGFAQSIYDKFESIAEKTESMISSCQCGGVEGCPACVMEDSCGSGNEPLHTRMAAELLDEMI